MISLCSKGENDMDTSINLPDNYWDKLLSLSDDMKLRIINKLSESLLNSENKRHVHARKEKTVKNETMLPKDIQELIGIASGVDDAEDERLNYLLNK